MLAIIVTLEELLDTIAPQLRLAFFDSFRIFPLLIVHMICVKVVDMDVWHVL